MIDKMIGPLNFHGSALVLRAQRQRDLASNIANADTPGYVARDWRFGQALRQASGMGSGLALRPAEGAHASPGAAGTGVTDPRHIPLPAIQHGAGTEQDTRAYALQAEPSLDGNTVDLDRERASFVDNAVRYEATLRFLDSSAKTMLGAIQGQ
ncbi:flagellar basal body rod protein FlgB [Verminephrobacter aporrectodeae subsp. tuberculatae]|uniref:flagellar basal body rod protein FlgB n=1 Tax=Verminephrobacter aporrectodeae TaxID=1110389 RepID=UPI002242F25D|nr:flagellar basal body rod protein FlgB [Verminephrobacter aporrectodeae]MCW8200560.1 flagellar basal body rod protein FlgB [Verminephrobacter aporrectodeae subsp. tuberculatae]